MSDLTNTSNSSQAEATSPAVGTSSPLAENKKTPKRPRRSFIERAQEESEELVRTMGGSLELDGGRRTRSSTRGTPTRGAGTHAQVTPPPTKKSRSSPTTPKSARSRGRKIVESAIEDSPPVQKDVAPEKVEKANVPEKIQAEKLESVADKNNDKQPKKNEDADKTKNQADNITDTKKDAAHSGDKTDAAEEAEENHIDHEKSEQGNKLNEQSEEVNEKQTETPMETDESTDEQPSEAKETKSEESTTAIEKSVSKDTEKNQTKIVESLELPKKEATPAAAVVQKEPTPEPMEIDSSTKSNQTVEPVDSVEPKEQLVNEAKAKATIKPTPTTTESKEVKENSNTEAETPAESVAASDPEPTASTDAPSQLSETESAAVDGVAPTIDLVEEPEEKAIAVDTAQKIGLTDEVISNNVENDVKSTTVVDSEVAGEPLATKATLLSSENNKSENSETCEPKLANNASEESVSTPQVAN